MSPGSKSLKLFGIFSTNTNSILVFALAHISMQVQFSLNIACNVIYMNMGGIAAFACGNNAYSHDMAGPLEKRTSQTCNALPKSDWQL